MAAWCKRVRLRTGTARGTDSGGILVQTLRASSRLIPALLGSRRKLTLRLIEAPEVTLFMSFGFDTLGRYAHGANDFGAQAHLCAECYGFDPYYNKSFEGQGFTFKEGLAVLADVVKSEGGIKGLWSSFKVAAASGKTFLRDVPYSLHMTFDSFDKDVAHKALQLARKAGVPQEHRVAAKSITRCQPSSARIRLAAYAQCCWARKAKCGFQSTALCRYPRRSK